MFADYDLTHLFILQVVCGGRYYDRVIGGVSLILNKDMQHKNVKA